MKQKISLPKAVVFFSGLLILTALWLPPAIAYAEDAVTPQSFMQEMQPDDVERSMWADLTAEEQSRVLHYYSIGKQSNLTNEQLKTLGYRVMSYFYYIQASINYINNPTGKYKGGPGKRVLGKQIEKLIPQIGTIFSDKGKQLDDAIKSIMTEHIRKSDEGIRKSEEGIRKSEETLKVLNETLKILEQIQKSF